MTKSSVLLLAGLLVGLLPAFSQQQSNVDDPVLFTYGDRSVTKSEFEYVFEKNNPEIESPTLGDLKDYLDLYVKFKIKVAAARDARIDTVPAVRNDLNNYVDQLYESYLDKLVLQPLMDEVKERWKEDVRARHILVNVPQNATAGDTAAAYKKIMKIRERIVNGEDFDKVAVEASDDRYARQNEGDLGYVNVLRLPYYDFENKLYETEVGEVSMPVRTRLGYHIIMPVERRPAVGTVEVAHILVKLDPQAGDAAQEAASKRIDSVYQMLQDGKAFGTLAREYSDDQTSKTRDGAMQPFTAGEMVPDFETAAFSLEDDSSFTKPFRTRYGYHILMLLDKEEKEPFAESETRIKRQVKDDERYEHALNKQKEQYKAAYGYEEMEANLPAIAEEVDSSVYEGRYAAHVLEQPQPLFKLNGRTYTANDLLGYIQQTQKYERKKSFVQIVEEAYEAFTERTIVETAIAEKYPEYTNLKKEYQDGILMFAMMQDSVWDKAMKDTAGLKAYYEQNMGKYMWQERAAATIFEVKNPDAVPLKKLKRKARHKTKAELYELFNDTLQRNLVIDSMVVEKGRSELIDSVKWQKGWSKEFAAESGEGYRIVKINRIIPPGPKDLSEARGAYIADYQTKLEEEWVATLRKRYPVKVNEEVLKTLVE